MKLFDMIVASKVLGGGGVTPTGTINITQNGDADVTNYATAHVAVPQPSGTVSITQNGVVDVTQYASANVSVSGGGGDEALAGLVDRSITSIDIPSGVTKIGKNAFYECTELENVTIPNSVTQILDYAFCNCSKIKSIVLPSGLTWIGANSFWGVRVATFDLPSGVTRINNAAFRDNPSLETLICRAVTPPYLGSSVFASTNITHIYVPSESVDAYKAKSGWSSYASIISAIPSA